MICGVNHSSSSDSVLLWLWHRLAAVAPIHLIPSLGTSMYWGCGPKKTKGKKKKTTMLILVMSSQAQMLGGLRL